MKKAFAIICSTFLFAIAAYGQGSGIQEGLSLKYLVQTPAEKTQHIPVIILLHGYGSDERDLFELRTAFPKNYLIVAARAPYSLPGGGYQWYTGSASKGQRDGDEKQLGSSRQLIEKFIGEVTAKYRADAKEVYVIGFSQGAIMSYEVGLTHPEQVKGIGALSGMIFESLKPLVSHTTALKQLKIFISHGTADERIPFADGKSAADYLSSLGLKPAFHQYAGMGHTISNEVLNDLRKWLNQ